MKTTKFLLTCALFTATAIVGLQPISAKVLYVGTGAQWAGKPDVHATPNAAFTAAAEGDEIWIAGGTYDITSRFTMTTSGVGKLVSFYGGFAGTENAVGERAKTPNGKGWEFANPTTLKQTGTITGGMFYASNMASTTATNFTIDGLILEGYDNNNNCGLYWQSNTPLSELNISVKNCWVKNFGNAGASSGGIRLVDAADPIAYNSFVVDSCLIENNKGGSGGGVYIEGFKTIKNSIIRNNIGANGGGIYIYTGTPATGTGLTITGCLIEGNTATTNGGGIYVRDVGAKHNIHNCIVVNNAATSGGGGVYFYSTGNPVIAKISNLTIANNHAYDGAGAYFAKAKVGVYNTIFYNNRGTYGNAVENIYALSATQPSPFKNNIVDKDYKFPDSSGCVISTNGEAIFGYGWITLPSSSGKDKGTADVGENLTLPAIDYAGNARIQGDAIDIGPYECAPITDNTPPTAPENLTLKSTGKTTLTLEWSKSADDVLLKGYSISVNGGAPNILTTASLDASYSNLEKVCYQLTGLAENTQHSVSVQAIDWADNLSTAATGSFSTTNADDPAKIWYVGSGWQGKPFNRLKETPTDAYTAAAAGDEIWIAGGTYNVTFRFTMTSKLVSFYGGFAGTENNVGERAKTPNGKGWEFAHPTILKQAVSLTTAMFYAYSPAAAAHANASTISINGLTLDGNSRYNNGGILWRTGTALPTLNVSIKNCTVQNFGATGTPVTGGGLSIVGAGAYASFVVDSCLIENNTGSSGGGVHVEGEKTIRNSAILNNTAKGTETETGGGGIYIYAGTAATGAGLTITGCLIEGNTAAANGGGVHIRDVGTKHNIHNCIVVNNATTGTSTGIGRGGGLYFSNTEDPVIAKISNLTIANNQSYYGAGAYFGKAGVGVYNTIFYNNRDNTTSKTLENIYPKNSNKPSPFKNNIVDQDYKFPDSSGCVITTDGGAIFGQDWVTLLTSIGTDKGTADVGENFTLPTTDYAGNARIQGDAIDIGPYEYEIVVDKTPPTAPENLTLTRASKTTLALEWGKSTDDVLLKGYTISVNDGDADTITLENIDASYSSFEKVRYLIAGLAASTAYSVSVQAIDWSSNLSTAATGSFSTTSADDPANIWYVGSGWQEKPFNRIASTPNAAFTAAAEGDEIWIAGGAYNVTSRFTLGSKLVSFYGGFAGTENTIDERAKTPNGKGWEFTHPSILSQAGATSIMFEFYGRTTVPANASISLNGLTLDGNKGALRGIYWNTTADLDLSVSIKNCIVQNFTTVNAGGGISLNGSKEYRSFVVDSCLIQNNKANLGGGVQVAGVVTLQNCEIRNNTATHATLTDNPEATETPNGSGGGIFLYGAVANRTVITSCLIANNTAYNGGGMFLDYGTSTNQAIISSCVVVNNTASYGGGVAFSGNGANTRLVNFTVASNSATVQGGGVYLVQSSQAVNNSILWNNLNTSSGSEVENVYVSTSALSSPVFKNNIIDKAYDNLTPERCIESSDSSAIFGKDWTLAAGSIAEDEGDTAGIASFIPATDFAGSARVVGGAVDIGAYERQAEADAPLTPQILSVTPDISSLTLTWTAAPGGAPAAGYYIYLNKELKGTITDGGVTTYTISGLLQEVTYAVQMAAYGEDGKISPKTLRDAHVVTTLNGSPPTTPQNLTVVGSTVKGGGASVKLSWKSSTDEGGVKGYYVHVTESGAYSYTWTEPLATDTFYTVSYLYSGSSYAFTVSAVDLSGASSEKSNSVSQTISSTDGSTGEAGVGEGKNSITLYPLTIALKQTPNMEGEMSRLGHMQKKYDRQPTGFYVENKKSFSVTVEAVTDPVSGETLKPTLYIGTYGYYAEKPQSVSLNTGANSITASQSGLIWLQYTSGKKNIRPTGEARITFADNSKVLRRTPRYIHGVTTDDEFAAMMNRYQSAPSAVLESDYTVVVPSRSAALEISTAISKPEWMNDLNKLFEAEDKISGLDDDDVNAVHHRLPAGIRHAMLEYEGYEGIFASASAHGYVHFTRPNSVFFLKPFKNFTRAEVEGKLWGLAHELGHQHQQSNYFIDDASEGTVNIYAYVVIRDILKKQFNTTLNRTTTSQWTSAKNGYLKRAVADRVYPVKDSPDNIDGLSTNVLRFMAWEQLFLVFGDEFYQRLHRLTREAGELYPAPDPVYGKDGFEEYDQDRKAFLIRVASQITGYDLRSYFNEWGIRVTDAAKNTAMNNTIDAAIAAGTISASLPNSLTIADLMAVESAAALPSWAPLPLNGIRETGSQMLSKKSWTISLNSLTTSGSNYKENIIDGGASTAFTSSNKPANGGFTIDFHDILSFSSFTYTQPTGGGTDLRATNISLLGSSDGATFVPIAENVSLTTGNGATTTKSFTTVACRYVKLVYNTYGSGSGVSIAELDLGLTSLYGKVTAKGDEHVTITSPLPAEQPFSLLRGKDFIVDFAIAKGYRIKEVKVHHVGGEPIATPVPVKTGVNTETTTGYSLTIHRALADSIGVEIATDKPTVTVAKTEAITIISPAPVGEHPYKYEWAYESPFEITFSVAPSHENPIATVDGTPVALAESNATYTLTIGEVATDASISITASVRKFTVSVAASAGIENVDVSTGDEVVYTNPDYAVTYGSAFTLTFKLATGYESPTVTINDNSYALDEPIGGMYTVTIAQVTANTSVSISAQRKTFSVALAEIVGVAITSTQHSQPVAYGDKFNLAFTLQEGFTNPKVFIDQATEPSPTAEAGGSYKLADSITITKATSLRVIADTVKCEVSVDESCIEVVSPAGASPYSVKYDSAFVLRFRLKAGFQNPVTAKVNGSDVSAPAQLGDEYTLTLQNVKEAKAISIAADVVRYLVTINFTGIENLNVTGGVKQNGDEVYSVKHDSTLTLTFKVQTAGNVPAVAANAQPLAITGPFDGVYAASIAVTQATTITISASTERKMTLVNADERVKITSPTKHGIENYYPVADGQPAVVVFTVTTGYEPKTVSIGATPTQWTQLNDSTYSVTTGTITSDISITITTDVKQFTVSLTASDDAIDVVGKSNETQSYGATYSLTFKVKAGYVNPQVTVDGKPYALGAPDASGVYTVTIDKVTSNTTISISAAIQTFRFSIANQAPEGVTDVHVATGNGVSAGTGANAGKYIVNYNSSFTVSFKLSPSHENLKVTLNAAGAEATPVRNGEIYTVTIDKATSDTAITLTASTRKFKVTTTVGEGITLTTSHNTSEAGVDSVTYGSLLTHTFFVVAAGYAPVVTLGNATSYTPTPTGSSRTYRVRIEVTSDTSINVSASVQTYTVTVNSSPAIKNITLASASGVTGSNPYTVKHDSAFVLRFELDTVGFIPPLIIAGATVSNEGAVYTATIDHVTSNRVLNIPAPAYAVCVTKDAGITSLVVPATNGVASIDDNRYKVTYDSTFTLSFNLTSGYENPQVTVGGTAVTSTLSNGTYSVSFTVTQSATVNISASLVVEPTNYTVTVAASAEISDLNPAGSSHTVADGSTFTLSFSLTSGYENPQVTVGGNTVTPTLSNGTYSVSFTVTQSATVNISASPVVVEPTSYTVTVAAGAEISNLNPAGSSHSIADDSTFTLSFSLTNGYENPQVTVDGTAVPPTLIDGTYSVSFTVTQSATVNISASLVVVEPTSYTVTVAAGAGISNLNPAGNSHSIADGSTFTLSFSLTNGYENPQVTVGGTAVTPTLSNGTYSVSFTVTQSATVNISATLKSTTGIDDIEAGDFVVATIYYTILGQEVRRPYVSGIYLVKEVYFSKKVTVTKRLIIVNN